MTRAPSPPDHRRRDGLQVKVGDDRRRRDRPVPPDGHPSRQTRDQARQSIGLQKHLIGADTGKVRRVRVIAHRVDVPPEGRVVQHVPQPDIQRDHRHHAQRHHRAADLEADAEDMQPLRRGGQVGLA